MAHHQNSTRHHRGGRQQGQADLASLRVQDVRYDNLGLVSSGFEAVAKPGTQVPRDLAFLKKCLDAGGTPKLFLAACGDESPHGDAARAAYKALAKADHLNRARQPLRTPEPAPAESVYLPAVQRSGAGPSRPVPGQITSNYGMRPHPIRHVYKFHQGVDFAAPTGAPVVAVADGIVKFSGRRRGYGNLVEISHAAGYSTRSGHLSMSGVREGQPIRKGQVIGAAGATGTATGPHVHFEVRRNGLTLNPLVAAKLIPSSPAGSVDQPSLAHRPVTRTLGRVS